MEATAKVTILVTPGTPPPAIPCLLEGMSTMVGLLRSISLLCVSGPTMLRSALRTWWDCLRIIGQGGVSSPTRVRCSLNWVGPLRSIWLRGRKQSHQVQGTLSCVHPPCTPLRVHHHVQQYRQACSR